ncbi:MAG: TIGR02099 family protein [Gammaproteobacteria bacterium]|nr:TIGR02099 family protein [Gammaproteobacteria bacterium]
MIHHVTRATKHLIFWSLVLTAIALTGIRVALTGVERYKSDLETRISALVGTPVKFGKLSANMRGVSPELVVKDIKFTPLLKTENTSLHFQEIRFGINLGRFLLTRDSLSSSSVTVVGATLNTYRNTNGDLVVEGLKAGKGQPLWLLQGRKYELLQSHVTWQDKLKQARPVILDNVNVAIINQGDNHRINALAKTPESLGEGLTAIVNFTGAINRPEAINGKLYLKADRLKLSEILSPYLPEEFGLTAGIADLSLWGQWQQGALALAQTEARLENAVLAKKAQGNFRINQLDTQINWQHKAEQWQADVGRFNLETPDSSKKTVKKWPEAVFSVAVEQNAEASIKSIKLYAKQMDIAETAAMAQFFASKMETTREVINKLAQAQLTGVLKDFSMFVQPESEVFAVAGWFNGVSFASQETLPGLTNISGQVKGSDEQGVIELISQNSQLHLPALFAKPLVFSRINGQSGWRKTAEGWRISSPSMVLINPAFSSESRVSIDIPDTEEKPFLDVQIAVNSEDVSKLKDYLPTQVMNEKLKSWLSNAFVNGKISNGGFLIYGKAGDFPFNDGSGVFEGSLEVINGELNYHPQWPRISGINGTVTFDKNNLTGRFHYGVIEKAVINKTDMLISSLGIEPMLTINGEGQGEVNQGLAILQHSPLAERVNPLLTGISAQGSAKAFLNLEIPLHTGKEIKVDGKAQLINDQMTVNRLGLKITGINGDLKFDNKGIYGEKIQGVALNHPIQANISQAEQHTMVDVSGKASVSAVENLFNLPDSKVADGESDYLLELKIPKIVDNDNPFDIQVKSTLEGVALNVPGLMVKSKEQAKPSVFNVKLTDQEALPVELDFNSELKAAVSLNATEKKLNSGHILIGKGEPKQRKTPGIKLEVSQENLALQDWLGMASDRQSGATGNNVNEVTIHSQSAYWQKTRLGPFNLTLTRNGQNWDGDIDSVFGTGKFVLPLDSNGVNPTVLNMDSINLTALKQLKLQEGTVGNSGFKPYIHINSKKTLWQSENLGALTLQTERMPNGIKIKKLDLIGADEKLFMTGNWKETGIKSVTHINGKLEMTKADELFDRLNIIKDLTKTSGVINFKLNWAAPPWHISLPTLQGTLDAKLKDGRILSIEPGFGRLLGMIAVAQWIKRLQLDFSDVYEEGLTFNSIKGHFDVLNGNARSKDLVIDAVPAKITIAGDTNLVNQTVDHVITVVPKSLDALPIAGTIVSKISSMVGKTLTGTDPEEFFISKQYLVKGSWSDIRIKQSYENGGLIQKTWRSITEFPWDEEQK